jgi:iron complex transport system substrate-binding protein
MRLSSVVPAVIADRQRILDDLSRRGLLAAPLAAALFLACRSDSEEQAAAPAPTTRTVRDAYGNDIVVPVAPQRVVAADNSTLPWVLELGVVPVASGTITASYLEGRDFHPALYALGAGEVKPYPRNEPDYELLAGLKPDLVIGAKFAFEGRIKDKGEGYRRLAPTVVVDTAAGPIASLRAVATILGREDRAERLIAEFESAITQAAPRPSVTTVSIVDPTADGQVYFYTEANVMAGTLARLLGITIVPGPQGANESGDVLVSGERLREAAGEALIIMERPDVSLDSNPLYRLLPSVQAGRVHRAGSYLIFFGNAGLAPLQEQLVGIATFLTAAG